tara:strand:+ start:1041 stop:1199 length:159 start_codon:yes stop_codon:yes gene_type:complete
MTKRFGHTDYRNLNKIKTIKIKPIKPGRPIRRERIPGLERDKDGNITDRDGT